MCILCTHIVEYLKLLARQVGTIVQCQCRLIDQPGHMGQPDLEEAQLY